MTQIPCPQCGTPLNLPPDGAVQCPQCGAKMSFGESAAPAAAEPIAKQQRFARPPAHPPAGKPTKPQPAADLSVTTDAGDSTGARISPWVYVAGAVGGVVVLALLVAILVQSFSSDDTPSPELASGNASSETSGGTLGQGTPGDGGEGTRPPDDPASKRPADAAKTDTQQGTSAKVSNKPPRTGNGRSAVPTWADPGQAVQVDAGELPLIDGAMLLGGAMLSNVNMPWTLVLPMGTHALDLGADGRRTIEPTAPFVSSYHEQAAKYQQGGRFQFETLLEASKPTAGVFVQPLLPHFWGNYYWDQGKREAAIRQWKWAVRLEPAFAPAHANLAFAYNELRDHDQAARETALAAAFNVQNAYGLNDHVIHLREDIGFDECMRTELRFDLHDYEDVDSGNSLGTLEQRVVDVLETLAGFAATPRGQAQAWNNAGVYLMHDVGQPERAAGYFRRGLETLAIAGTVSDDQKLAGHLLANLQQATEQAGFDEQQMYARLREDYR